MKITALILAGGEGSRMAGQDKGLQLWHGLPLIDHVLQTIAPQVQHTLISANRHLAEYASRSYPVLSDDKKQALVCSKSLFAVYDNRRMRKV